MPTPDLLGPLIRRQVHDLISNLLCLQNRLNPQLCRVRLCSQCLREREWTACWEGGYIGRSRGERSVEKNFRTVERVSGLDYCGMRI